MRRAYANMLRETQQKDKNNAMMKYTRTRTRFRQKQGKLDTMHFSLTEAGSGMPRPWESLYFP